MRPYVPCKGDFIVATFDPQQGHEQAGRRPALVVSNELFNRTTGLCIVCPVTNTRRDHPFHVALDDGQRVTGVVMVEQVKSVDFRARNVAFIGTASPQVLDESLAILDACLY